MASYSRRKLPNLKICVDNTKDDESEEDITDEEDTHQLLESKNVKRTIPNDSEPSFSGSSSDGSSNSDSESDSDNSEQSVNSEVEFNVRISGVPKLDKKSKQVEVTKRYENKTGNFITGIDLSSKEAIEKKDERAKRFGLPTVENKPDIDRTALLSSLGLKEEDIEKGERGIRLEAIHMRGTDEMSTQDIFKYFGEFGPGRIEWIDDSSCNVVWFDSMTTARAMLAKSRDYTSVVAEEEKKGCNNNKQTTITDSIETETIKSEKVAPSTEVSKSDDGQSIESEKTDSKNATTEREENMEVDDNLDLNAESNDEEDIKDVKIEETDKQNDDKQEDKQEDKQDVKVDDDVEMLVVKENKVSSEDKSGSERRKERKQKTIWPPGKWRLGQPDLKAKFIFLRYANKADKKLLGAENKSKYYIKHGNPNYGGEKGILSGSRKRRIRAVNRNEDCEPAKSSWESKRSEDEEEEEKKEEIKKPKELFTDKNKQKVLLPSEDMDDLDIEAELQELLGPPVKKRSMRMYADDIEVSQKQTRSRISTGGLIIMTDARQGMESRLGREMDDVRNVQDVRSRISDARDKLSNSKDRQQNYLSSHSQHKDYSSRRRHKDYSSSHSQFSNDLRSKLKNKKLNSTDHLSGIKIEIYE